jgi:hypothetical protein
MFVIFLLTGLCFTYSAISCVHAGAIVLAQSGLNSIIADPGPSHPAAYSYYNYPHHVDAVPSARWIWDGPGDSANCSMDITVQEVFTMKCLNRPMTVYIAADNSYKS